MRLSFLALPALAAANPFVRPRAGACPNQNCLLVLDALTLPINAVVGDCSSYLRTTITPPTSTISKTTTVKTTVTATVDIFIVTSATATVEGGGQTGTLTELIYTNVQVLTSPVSADIETAFAKRTGIVQRDSAAPTPTYAAACSGLADYQSACSCLGVLATTQTLPTPKTTVTSTVLDVKKTVSFFTTALTETLTATKTVDDGGEVSVTVTEYGTATSAEFIIADLYTSPVSYAMVQYNATDYHNEVIFVSDITQADFFFLDGDQALVQRRTYTPAFGQAVTAGGSPTVQSPLYFDPNEQQVYGYQPLRCSQSVTPFIDCSAEWMSGSTLVVCNNRLEILEQPGAVMPPDCSKPVLLTYGFTDW